jgi:prepilin-type processing-associated H-X9-DG protein
MCVSNLKQLQTGAALYQLDSADILLPNAPGGYPTDKTWCSGAYEDWNNADANTNPIPNLTSLLAPHVGMQIRIYRCPADKVPAKNGERLRSYVMNARMGACYDISGLDSPSDPYRWYVRAGNMVNPGPANLYVFLEEHPESNNDGFFNLDVNHTGTFDDVPSAYHAGSCCFSFADGHVIPKKWLSGVIPEKVVAGQSLHTIIAGSSNPDWRWCADYSTGPK